MPGEISERLTKENFSDVLDILIMIPNLQKLLYIGRPASRNQPDPAGRTPEVLYAELVKYMSCLIEARELWSAPPSSL
jgi:hypothetical protein